MSKEVALLSAFQQPGTTARHVCPKCNGGTFGEPTLSLTVSNDGGLYWICFRGTCGFKGCPAGASAAKTTKAKREPKVYTRSIKQLSRAQEDALDKLYGSTFEGSGIGYNDDTDRFVLPVDGPGFDDKRGVIARSLSGGSPKTLNFVEAQPFVHFAYPSERAQRFVAVVVEDWFSAEKVAEAGFIGVSINGTNLTQEAVNEIRDLDRRTVIALDLDAFAKGCAYAAKYREQFKYGLSVARLVMDLKYETHSRIVEIVDASGTSFTSGRTGV